MIPLNDCEPNRYTHLPVVTILIITTNALIMLFVLSASTDATVQSKYLGKFGSVPRMVVARQGGGALTSVTSMFIHVGPFHLFGNMLGLWVYGRRVEDACGRARFLLFYLTCGIFADLVHTFIQADSNLPIVGASGAVFGVMGAYLILYPAGRIRTLVMLGIVPIFPKIRAVWLILYFLVLELAPAFQVLFSHAQYRIGHWAHLGGFFAGLAVLCFLRPEAFHRYWNELTL